MALRSGLFQGDARLEACAILDSAHVAPGAIGDHVNRIQTALATMGAPAISSGETASKRYGPSTAAAVLQYKQKRGIINRAYQAVADNIVGKMTIAAMDIELVALGVLAPLGIAGASIFGILGLGAANRGAGTAVLSVNDGLANKWATQFIARQPQSRRGVLVSANPSVTEATDAILRTIASAGSGGVVIFNDGHGAAGPSGNPAEGSVDLAPQKRMRLGGLNSNVPGQPLSVFANVFYDVNVAGPPSLSDQENDRQFNPNGVDAKQRAANFKIYQRIGAAFRASSTRGVIFLTCNVGKSVDFLRKIANDWNLVVAAYKRRVALQQLGSGRVRMFLFGDAPGSGTNIAINEEEIPLGTAVNSVRVGPPV